MLASNVTYTRQALYAKNVKLKICNRLGCEFSTAMEADCLSEHCKTKHGWEKRNCPHGWCKFKAYNDSALKAEFIKLYKA